MKVTPKSRSAWRNWLQKNHGSCAEVEVIYFKKHTGKPTLTYNESVEEAICFGWIDGVKRSIDAERYSHRFTPRQDRSKWSPTNRRRAQRMIDAGLMTDAGSVAIRRAKRAGTWDPPDESLDLAVPSDLADRLRRNRSAAEFFESLAPSYRNQFVAWINAAKRNETRQRRIDEALALLSQGKKLGMR